MHEETREGRSDGPRKKRRRRSRTHRKKSEQPRQGAQKALSTSSSLDLHSAEAKDARTPMSPDEIREMKEHLQFLCKHRHRLKLKINANEDLLLNGAREPTERGVCMHLLRKVDRSCVETALRRTEDSQTRTLLLQGIVRFSSDVGFLILYLESLRETESKTQAAAALSLGLKRIDFDKASKAQMTRVMDLILSLFPQESLPQLLFGFLQNPSFRNAFDHSADRLPVELADIFVPIRALFSAIVEDQDPDSPSVLRTGLSLFSLSSIDSLKELSEPTRRRLFEFELALTEEPNETDKILAVLLESIPKKERLYGSLALLWVRQLLRRECDEKAESLLAEMAGNHPRFEVPKRWLRALKQDRVGRIALKNSEHEDSIQRGFWLKTQQDVLVRIGTAQETEAFEEQAQIHRSLQIPGVAPFASNGLSKEGLPYIATATLGQPAKHYNKQPPAQLVIEHMQEGLRLLWCLANAEVAIAEFGFACCFIDAKERLWLQDLSQCTRSSQSDALEQNLRAAKKWCEDQMTQISPKRLHLFAQEELQKALDFQALMQWSQTLLT